jgi:hypothetical protein
MDKTVYVAELWALDAEAFDGLLIPFLRAQPDSAVSLIVLGDMTFADRLARFGFLQRDVDRSMMLYVPATSPLRSLLHRADRFTLFRATSSSRRAVGASAVVRGAGGSRRPPIAALGPRGPSPV